MFLVSVICNEANRHFKKKKKKKAGPCLPLCHLPDPLHRPNISIHSDTNTRIMLINHPITPCYSTVLCLYRVSPSCYEHMLVGIRVVVVEGRESEGDKDDNYRYHFYLQLSSTPDGWWVRSSCPKATHPYLHRHPCTALANSNQNWNSREATNKFNRIDGGRIWLLSLCPQHDTLSKIDIRSEWLQDGKEVWSSDDVGRRRSNSRISQKDQWTGSRSVSVRL